MDVSQEQPVGPDVLNTLGVAVAVAHDPLATRITINRYFASLLGITAEANASVLDCNAPFTAYRDGRRLTQDELPVRIAARTNEPVAGWEAEIERADGTRIRIAGEAVPIRDDHGNARGSVGVFRDMSIRLKDDLLTTPQRLAAIVESSDDAIIAKDLNGIVTAWNRAAERMFGYTAGEAIGRSIRFIVPAERQDEEEHIRRRVVAGDGVDRFETVRARKSGRLINVSLTASPIRTRDGAIVGTSTIARDITDRKRAEADARRSQQRAAFLANVATALVESLDYQQTLEAIATLAVPQLADWCAVDIVTERGEIERLAVAHVDPAKIPIADDVRRRYGNPQSPYSPASVIRTRTGVMLSRISDDMIVAGAGGDEDRIGRVRALGLVSYVCVPLLAHRRTLGALTFATTAESGREYADADLRLFEDVAARAALAIDTGRAYEQLQEANRIKDEFLATLSHELRTPLNAILGYARMLKSGLIAAEKRTRALEIVERNATSLAQIVNDVLDVSRIVAGKVRLEIEAVDLPAIVSDAVATVLPAADAKRVRVQTIIDPDASPVSGDPNRLRQVIWNLVSNAVKFTPREGRVQVRLERVESAVEVTVSDTGIGIKPEFLPHIFERFRQADGSPTREHGGLGLGLAIARHLVELHGGTIDATSAGEGLGATFRVRMPIMSVRPGPPLERRRPQPQSDVMASAPPPVPDLHGVRVLAVDDDRDSLRMVCEVLEVAGAEVTTADSAMEALERLQRTPPDVLLADIGMPAMDGIELMCRIRRSSDRALRLTPAAALTAYVRAEDRAKILASGFQMHLGKPVDPQELLAAVATLANRPAAIN